MRKTNILKKIICKLLDIYKSLARKNNVGEKKYIKKRYMKNNDMRKIIMCQKL